MAGIDDTLRRVPPQSIEAEESVLGGILLDNNALDRLAEVLQPDDFYREAHRKIFRGMQRLTERSEPVDLITLSEALRSRGGELPDVGGAAYLAELAERVPTAANVAPLRAHRAGQGDPARPDHDQPPRSRRAATRPGQDVKRCVERAEQQIFAISERKVRPPSCAIDALLGDTFRKHRAPLRAAQLVTGVPTGFVDLDKLTAGLQPSDLIIVAGRPSMGKTAFCLNIAEYAALRADCGVAVFSLEMSKEQLVLRMLCSEARVDLAKVRTGHLTRPRVPRARGSRRPPVGRADLHRRHAGALRARAARQGAPAEARAGGEAAA